LSKILGVDPGLVKTGWGVICKEARDDVRYVDCGVIKTKSNLPMEERLSFIFDAVQDLIFKFEPASIAMEEVFVNMNPKTSEKLIMARSAAFVAIAKAGFQVNEYRPNEIKKNITGLGHATKEQVHFFIQKILNITLEKDNKTKTADSMDALAVALCCAFSRRDIFKALQ
jgi:crossover junction endodeoxyribonuclease RuvC